MSWLLKSPAEAGVPDDGLGTLKEIVRRHWPLGLLLLLAAVLRGYFFVGILGSDDTAYALNAIGIRNGTFILAEDMTAMRLGLNAAAAGAMALLGTTEWALGLPAFIGSLLTLAIAYAIGWIVAGRPAAIITGVFFAFAPLNILTSSSLLPEVPMALFASVSVCLSLVAQRSGSTSASIGLCVLSGIALGSAYLFKEPAILMTGVFASAGAIAWYRGERRWWLYGIVLLGFAAVFLGETFVYHHTTAVWLRRFREIADYQAAAVARSEQERRLQSMWLYPRNMFFVLNQVGLLFYFLMAGWLLAVRRRWSAPPGLIVLWLVIPFLYLEFGSTSLSTYNALPKQPRYLEAMTAPAVILIGDWCARLWTSPRPGDKRVVGAAVTVFVVTSLFFTALSAVDRRAATEPIRASAGALDTAGWRLVYATPMVANALSVFRPADPRVERACTGCVAGPCGHREGTVAGEVWAVARGTVGLVASPSACARWRVAGEIPVMLPGLRRGFVRAILLGVDALPEAAAPVKKELRPLRALLEPRHVVVNVPAEVQ